MLNKINLPFVLLLQKENGWTQARTRFVWLNTGNRRQAYEEADLGNLTSALQLISSKLLRGFVKSFGELFSKFGHVLAKLHHGYHSLNLVVNFIPAKFLQPLMVIF